MLCLAVAGCLPSGVAGRHIGGQVDVFGLDFGAPTEYRQLHGTTGTDEPCLHGYERSFDDLGVIVGYGFDRRIRKVSTSHPSTSVFGVRPGMEFARAEETLQRSGLVRDVNSQRWSGVGFVVTLLPADDDTVAGVIVETGD